MSRAAQAVLGLVHEVMGSLDVGSDELPVSLDDIAADDHRLDVRGSCAEHHDRDGVAEPVEVRRAHVHDGDVGLFARRQAPDLVFEVPHPGAIEGGEPQHVTLMEIDRLDPLSSRQCGGVGPGALGGQSQTHLGEQVRAGAAYGVHPEPTHDPPPERTARAGVGAELHEHVR